MRRGDIVNVSPEDAAAERRVGPMARQICLGSRKQLMVDCTPDGLVECPACLKVLTVEATVRNRDQVCPVVPSHMADQAGVMQVALSKRARRGAAVKPF